MEKFMQNTVGPLANKLASNRYLVALRDAFMLAFPLTMFGSFVLIILNFPGFSTALPNFHDTVSIWFSHSIDATMNMMAVFVSFGLGYYISKSRGVDAIYGGAISLASFFIVTPFFATGQEGASTGIYLYQMGAQGMFVAMIIGISSTELYSFLTNKNLVIKMPEQVPPTVAKSFAAIIPGTITLFCMTIIYIIFLYTPSQDIHTFVYNAIQIPLQNLGTSYPATVTIVFFSQFFFFFGIHGQILVNSIMDPIWYSLALENINGASHIVTKPFMDTFTVGLGGTGATLPLLVVILLISKDKAKREIAKLSFAPGLFNVNEPVIFGLPIVLNFKLVIPWLVAPLVSVTIAYIAMALGLVPVTTGAVVPWTVPVVISGFLATSSWQGAALQIVQLIVVGLIWVPFIKFGDIDAVKAQSEQKPINKTSKSVKTANKNEALSNVSTQKSVKDDDGKQKRILLVCASGMSTSLLVTKMQKASDKRGLNTIIAAKGNSSVEQYKDDWDVCLLGPQISYAKDEITKKLSPMPVGVIDMQIYGKGDGDGALDMALNMLD